MNNTWFRIAVSVFFCTASNVFAAPGQETDFVLVALEQLRDRMERDDKGTLDEFIIKEGFTEEFRPDDESILDNFYQEAARTVAQEVSPLFD